MMTLQSTNTPVKKRKGKRNNKDITQPRAAGEKAVNHQAQERVR